jgi:hypothetical protein
LKFLPRRRPDFLPRARFGPFKKRPGDRFAPVIAGLKYLIVFCLNATGSAKLNSTFAAHVARRNAFNLGPQPYWGGPDEEA